MRLFTATVRPPRPFDFLSDPRRDIERQFSIKSSVDFDFIALAHIPDCVFDLCDVHDGLALPFHAKDP
jgi:hypothetical protein